MIHRRHSLLCDRFQLFKEEGTTTKMTSICERAYALITTSVTKHIPMRLLLGNFKWRFVGRKASGTPKFKDVHYRPHFNDIRFTELHRKFRLLCHIRIRANELQIDVFLATSNLAKEAYQVCIMKLKNVNNLRHAQWLRLQTHSHSWLRHA